MSGGAAKTAVQPDWDLVPEATHYQPPIDDSGMFNPVFWRAVDGRLVEAWAVYGGKVRHYPNPVTGRDLSGRLIPRPAPAAAEWDGVGLPSVGTVCEYFDNKGEWYPAVMSHIGSHLFIVKYQHPEHGQQESCMHIASNDGPISSRLRPIRTPEQIAAEEREREQALREACEIVGCAPGSMYGIEVVKKLIDADYRKRPTP